MKKKELCPVCKGSGKEEHKYIRNDGEEAVEIIPCELCGGTGTVKSEPEYKPEVFPYGYETRRNSPFGSFFDDNDMDDSF